MPDNNADLALVEVEFQRLADDSAASCPVPLDDLLRHLADEVPGGEALTADALSFVRTALDADTRYWLWRFNEPDGGIPRMPRCRCCRSVNTPSGTTTTTTA
jgi:hypothetical protein